MAGNVWEYITKIILTVSGVFKHDELKIDAKPYDDCLEVHGRCDFIAGGYIDYDTSIKKLEELFLPDYLYTVGKKIIEVLAGKNLMEKILELKSVSTFAYNRVEKSKAAIPNHIMQAYHYQKNKGIPANLVYLCKDDCRMIQFYIEDHLAEPLYRQDLEKMTYYYKKKKTPPLEPLVKFEPAMGRFSKNLGVEYSPFLEHYGYSDPDAYRDAVKFVESWNRVLSRYAKAETGQLTPTGKPISITASNKEVRSAIEVAGFEFGYLLQCAIEAGIAEEEELAEF